MTNKKLLTIQDHNEINQSINAGYTSGLIDTDDGYRLAWELTDNGIKVNKFKY